ncbi:ubiquinone biosynthesis protein COQ7 [Serpentinimonas maccroryi]|uniref:3-demethoxyubiquinol 3-hydroxylase n=1 Tax=Serpentinimonas maccroryi TaxID=1458426 RepID=A0A060NRL0_9BURK|nr:2-polyprenyl-3-methyl-6-methoxy-1,4-benzoquinone monooxygenase [Serpentinimonas maccroryi]BAO84000.1 ubiquinone biosynthesis protein COQ7 [Serpentinimonas maccroryi]
MSTAFIDAHLIAADGALRALFAPHRAARPCPRPPADVAVTALSEAEKRHAGALMRVNHVGEICAQALYTSQALAARLGPGSEAEKEKLAHHLEAAGQDETDHLAWCKQRLDELGDRPSLLNPLWFAGAFGLGLLAGRFGKGVSLGFVVETERQVEAHLDSHLGRLPAHDHASRAIVEQMKADEVRHANEAKRGGGVDLPAPVKGLMRLAAKVMTTVAHRV